MNVAAYGYKKCSLKHKIQPQEKFCNHYPPCQEVWAWLDFVEADRNQTAMYWMFQENDLPCNCHDGG